MLAEAKKMNSGQQKYVQAKDGGYECKFLCLDNDMVSLIEDNVNFGTFQVILENINVENIAKIKLVHVKGFNYVFL